MAIEELNAYHGRMQSMKMEVDDLLQEMGLEYLLPAINDFYEKSPFFSHQ